MATIKGFGFAEVKPQPGFTARQGENGGWTGRHTFAILKTAWGQATVRAQFQKGTSITTLDSGLSSFFSFMGVVETEVLADEGDIYMVGVEISGAQGAQYGDDEDLGGNASPTYQLSGQLQDAPLSSHKKWAALTDLEKTGLGFLIRGEFQFDLPTGKVGTFNAEDGTFSVVKTSDDDEVLIESTDGLEFAKLIARGETTYLRPTATWRESTQGTSGLTAGQINKLGYIATPRGSPPTPTGGRNWMLTNFFEDESGDKKSTDLEWTLSERGGHNSFLYED